MTTPLKAEPRWVDTTIEFLEKKYIPMLREIQTVDLEDSR